MSDDTPSTDDVRDRWSLGHTKNGAHFTTDAFDRWLESVRAEERERIARLLDEQHDKWASTSAVGHTAAFEDAARIAREGA